MLITFRVHDQVWEHPPSMKERLKVGSVADGERLKTGIGCKQNLMLKVAINNAIRKGLFPNYL